MQGARSNRRGESHSTRESRASAAQPRVGYASRHPHGWRALCDLFLCLPPQAMRHAVGITLPEEPPLLTILRAKRQTPVFGWPQSSGVLRQSCFGLASAILPGAFIALPVCVMDLAMPEFSAPLMPPSLPGDDHLMREFEDLLRENYERYLSESARYFRCLDAERARALREAAEVTTQYSMFLEALRRSPP